MGQTQAARAAREAFGAQVRTYRDLRGYTMEVLAGRVGKSASTISRIETGAVNVAIYDIQQLARVLDIPACALVDTAPPEEAASLLLKAHMALCVRQGREALMQLHGLVTQLEGLAG